MFGGGRKEHDSTANPARGRHGGEQRFMTSYLATHHLNSPQPNNAGKIVAKPLAC